MLAFAKKCKICNLCKEDKNLLNRIYNSTSILGKAGKEGLKAIQKDYEGKFSLPGLKNHTKNHQFIDSVSYNEANLKRIDRIAENRVVKKVVQANDAIQSVIDKGFDRLDNNEITVDTNQLIRASQVKLTAESKTKDQELKFMEMVAFFASGQSQSQKIYREVTDADPS